jgi:2-octaprenyl-6-methoxyphenol hydroxylase
MPINKDFKVVILGCGFSGMLTALSLAKIGVKITIIEAKSIEDENFYNDIRTTALTPASEKFLRHLDLWPQIEMNAGAILDIYVVDNKAPEMLHFSLDGLAQGLQDNAHTTLGYIVKNSEFKKSLLTQVRNNNLITIIDKCGYQKIESSDEKVTVYLSDNKPVTFDLLIICDGHNSKARNYYFTAKINKYYKQTALTFNVLHEKEHKGTAVEHFMPSGPFAILPLKNQHSSSIVWTVKDIQSTLLQSLPDKEFEYHVQKNFGPFLGQITLDSKIGAFPLKAYITEKYFYKRIILIADTAHIVHPLAGQGLNQGIKDIETLTELIDNIGINIPMLEKYQLFREDDNLAMYLITDNLNRIFSNDSEWLRYLRRAGLKVINHFNPVKAKLIKYAAGKR